jgi:hypothetical protein
VIEVEGGDVGPQGEGPADVLPGEVRLPALGGEDAEQVPGIGVGGIGVQDLAVEAFRLVVVAVLVLLQGQRERLGQRHGLPRRSCPRKGGAPLSQSKWRTPPPIRTPRCFPRLLPGNQGGAPLFRASREQRKGGAANAYRHSVLMYDGNKNELRPLFDSLYTSQVFQEF